MSRSATTALLGVLALLWVQPAGAQTVELNPVTLSGVISFPGRVIDTVSVAALFGSSVAASREFRPNPPLEVVPYSLTVQVPAGGSRGYILSISGRHDLGTFQTRSQAVVVNDGLPATFDLVFDPPTILEGTITVSGDGLLAGAGVNVRESASFSRHNFTASVVAPPGGARSLDYRIPVVPGVNFVCQGAAGFESGASAILPPVTTGVIAEGGVARCDFTVSRPELGALAGTVDFEGPAEVESYRIEASGAIRRSVVALRPFDGPGNQSSYRIENLSDGLYGVLVGAVLANGDIFSFPNPGRQLFSVAGGQDTIVDRTACQAFVEGEVRVAGTLETADAVASAGLGGSFRQDDDTFQGGALTSVDPDTGRYELVASAGTWFAQTVQIAADREPFVAPGFLDEDVSIVDLRGGPTLACGERLVRNSTLPTGRVEILFRVADGSFLIDPRLSGTGCRAEDEATGDPLYSYSFQARSANRSTGVPIGRVAFEGPAAVCDDVRATAIVGGSGVLFGSLRDIEVVPDTTIVIEPMGPRVEITSPAPGEIVDATEIVVRGLASDDVEVASVSVNGVPAALSSSGNPADPIEVAYEATIPLLAGENPIQAVAQDDEGLSAETTIAIFNEAAPPDARDCDANGDQQVDASDVAAIFALRGSPADGPDDPLDVNDDGLITINDGRLCVLQCDNPRCQPTR